MEINYPCIHQLQPEGLYYALLSLQENEITTDQSLIFPAYSEISRIIKGEDNEYIRKVFKDNVVEIYDDLLAKVEGADGMSRESVLQLIECYNGEPEQRENVYQILYGCDM